MRIARARAAAPLAENVTSLPWTGRRPRGLRAAVRGPLPAADLLAALDAAGGASSSRARFSRGPPWTRLIPCKIALPRHAGLAQTGCKEFAHVQLQRPPKVSAELRPRNGDPHAVRCTARRLPARSRPRPAGPRGWNGGALPRAKPASLAPRAQGPAPRTFTGRGARRGATGTRSCSRNPTSWPGRAQAGIRAGSAARRRGAAAPYTAPSSRLCRAAGTAAPAACTGAVWAPPGRAPPPNDTPSANGTAGPAAPAGRSVGRRAADRPPPCTAIAPA